MTQSEKERLIRGYATGEITWHELQERGFADYVQVLGTLGEFGRRSPVAPMEGPNVEARLRGRAPAQSLAGALVSEPFSLIVTDTSPLFSGPGSKAWSGKPRGQSWLMGAEPTPRKAG